ncbi:hypothetical protein Agub_g5445, partial [Astrephomene gubernaculifera]
MRKRALRLLLMGPRGYCWRRSSLHLSPEAPAPKPNSAASVSLTSASHRRTLFPLPHGEQHPRHLPPPRGPTSRPTHLHLHSRNPHPSPLATSTNPGGPLVGDARLRVGPPRLPISTQQASSGAAGVTTTTTTITPRLTSACRAGSLHAAGLSDTLLALHAPPHLSHRRGLSRVSEQARSSGSSSSSRRAAEDMSAAAAGAGAGATAPPAKPPPRGLFRDRSPAPHNGTSPNHAKAPSVSRRPPPPSQPQPQQQPQQQHRGAPSGGGGNGGDSSRPPSSKPFRPDPRKQRPQPLPPLRSLPHLAALLPPLRAAAVLREETRRREVGNQLADWLAQHHPCHHRCSSKGEDEAKSRGVPRGEV